MNTFKSFFRIFGINTFVVIGLAIASTWICRHYTFTEDFPLTLIGLAVVFPIVFSINGAYKRREVVLDQYGILKAHGRAIYFASRDWVGDDDAASAEKVKTIMHELLRGCRELFQSDEAGFEAREEAVYAKFSELSLFIKDFRRRGLATGEVSRSNQYMSKMVVAFEKLKHIHQYRTPRTLRAYSKVFIYILPVLYGPYFAQVAEGKATWLAYILPCLLSIILVSLDNIQEHLENPFDQKGEDDVNINAEKFVRRLEL